MTTDVKCINSESGDWYNLSCKHICFSSTTFNTNNGYDKAKYCFFNWNPWLRVTLTEPNSRLWLKYWCHECTTMHKIIQMYLHHGWTLRWIHIKRVNICKIALAKVVFVCIFCKLVCSIRASIREKWYVQSVKSLLLIDTENS